MFPKIDTLLDILLLMISVLSYWSRLYQHQMPAKPSYSASNNPGNRRKVKSREYGCIWWINTNNYALLAVSSNSNIRTQVGIFFYGLYINKLQRTALFTKWGQKNCELFFCIFYFLPLFNEGCYVAWIFLYWFGINYCWVDSSLEIYWLCICNI